MKLDPSLFPKLTDEAKFPAFIQAFEAAAQGTDIGEVMDFSHCPPANQLQSFRNKCHWVCNVLFNNVQTTEGRNILHKHRVSKV